MLACVASARAYNIGRRDGWNHSPDVSPFPQARKMQDAITSGDLKRIRSITDEISAANADAVDRQFEAARDLAAKGGL